jgi:hypothetical protein
MSLSTSRRSFLRALGAVAATMPFARLLERSAFGDPPAGPPLRFAAVYVPNGNPTEFWRPQPGFIINGLNQSLQPFDDAATFGMSFKDKLIVIDGIDNMVASESNSGGHASAPCVWTGSINSSTGPKCESIETYLGVTKGLGNSTAFPTSIYQGANVFGAGGVPLDSIANPQWLFTSLFTNFMPPAQQNAQAAADTLARGKSTLDFVSSSLTSLQNRLAAPEKALLDQHLTAIRQIENRLTAGPQTCSSIPTEPTSSSTSNGDYVNSTVIQIFAQAFACDITRFIQMVLADPGSIIGSSTQDPGVVPPLPLSWPAAGQTCADDPTTSSDCDHLDVAHKYLVSSPFTLGGGGTAAEITTQVRLARLNKYYSTQLATFAQLLNQNMLLDNTLIMTMSDVGNPALHDCIGLPTILLGGANGYFKMGQHIQLAQHRSQNSVFVAIANAFGIPITSYGVSANPSTTAGPLPGLTA